MESYFEKVITVKNVKSKQISEKEWHRGNSYFAGLDPEQVEKLSFKKRPQYFVQTERACLTILLEESYDQLWSPYFFQSFFHFVDPNWWAKIKWIEFA